MVRPVSDCAVSEAGPLQGVEKACEEGLEEEMVLKQQVDWVDSHRQQSAVIAWAGAHL